MPGIVLFDLDDTMLNREVAFKLWSSLFISKYGLSDRAWEEIRTCDADGYTPREEFFDEIKTLFGIEETTESLVEQYHLDYPPCYSVEEITVNSLRYLRAAGWKLGIVTNGPPSQRIKLEVTGITGEFDGICVSSVVGYRKPDPAIFQEAAKMCASRLEG